MGCEANVASRPAATSPSPQLTHGRHVISPLLLPYYLFLVSCFDICSDFIHFYLLFSSL